MNTGADEKAEGFLVCSIPAVVMGSGLGPFDPLRNDGGVAVEMGLA